MKKYTSSVPINALAYRNARALRSSSGFTLIEMVMVIALIGIVMSVVGSYAISRFNSGKYNAAVLGVKALAQRVENYNIDNGSYPGSLNDLVTRPASATNWNGPYAKPGEIIDPFNHPYQYKYPGDHGDYDIIFLGKDGKGSGTDLNKPHGNWE